MNMEGFVNSSGLQWIRAVNLRPDGDGGDGLASRRRVLDHIALRRVGIRLANEEEALLAKRPDWARMVECTYDVVGGWAEEHEIV